MWENAEPGELHLKLPELEHDLEALLSGSRINAPFMGRGGWVETVQNRPHAKRIA